VSGLLGRSGKPKKRLLRCDNSVSRLFWEKPPTESILGIRRKSSAEELTPDLPGEDKSVMLAEVRTIIWWLLLPKCYECLL
jgi:hypothetical protein